jgi:glycogen(starch) synthase
MQAGLMVISSDLPEIRRVIEAAGCGLLLADDGAQAIAACLAGLDPARIDACKQAALARARDLNFEAEGGKLLALVESLLAPGAA